VQKRILIVCALVTIASMSWMAFGGNSSKVDDERQVKAAVDAYVAAFVRGDGRAACDHLTDTARTAVIATAAKVGAVSCPQVFEKTRKLGGAKVRAVAGKIRVRKVDIDGKRAKVTLRAAGEDSVAELDKVGDKWKISSMPKA
jgi:hypothetical protein